MKNRPPRGGSKKDEAMKGTIIKNMGRAAATVVAVWLCLFCGGCFKKVTTDATLVIRPNLQTVSGETDMAIAQGVELCAVYGYEKPWSVASYADAESLVLTNSETGERESVEAAVVAEQYDQGATGVLAMRTRSPHVLLVAVYPEGGMYAYRHYDTAENLSPVYISFQFRTWKSDGYVDGDWTVGFDTNRLPDPDDTEAE